MHLNSLGQLRLTGEKFRREKPLLLLAYLCLEGPKARRFMAELFWPDAPNAMNNLAVAIAHVRKLGAASADELRVWSLVECDAVELRDHLRKAELSAALALYQGAFADGLGLDEVGSELEEWVLDTRETLARELRAALLWQAEKEAEQSNFVQAAGHAETAYRLPGSPPVEPEELPRFYRLLRAAEHPLSEAVEREARELEIPLQAPVAQVRQRLNPQFVGRSAELSRLSQLQTGQWAWVRGAAGMGKTALLRELSRERGWRYLPARAGLPYATLEPVLGDLEGSEVLLLRRLNRQPEPLVLDDWEKIDPESQHLLIRLHALKPEYPVILASSGEATLPVDLRLELTTLSAADLQDQPDALEITGGVPALVGAHLRGESLEDALEARLLRLGDSERQLHAALTLLPGAEVSLLRAALKLPAAELVRAHEHLSRTGLIDAGNQVRSPGAAQRYLDSEPALAGQVSLHLARQLPSERALPLYQRARDLWEEHDLPGVGRAYHHWGSELLRRGFPKRAVELLASAPPGDEITLLRARALERNSLFRQALDMVQVLPETHETQALKSRLLYKLGQPSAAQQAAENALGGPLEAEAEALNTLGEIALRKGQAQEGLELFSRSATLWQAAGQKTHWLRAMNNRAIANTILGGNVEQAFAEVLEWSADNPASRALAVTNMAIGYRRQKQPEKAVAAYQEAIRLAEETGQLTAATLSWNGLGVMYHFRQPEQARISYQAGLELARQTGDSSLIAMLLANLAELNGDIPAWKQAIELLERGGFDSMAREAQSNLETFMAR